MPGFFLSAWPVVGMIHHEASERQSNPKRMVRWTDGQRSVDEGNPWTLYEDGTVQSRSPLMPPT